MKKIIVKIAFKKFFLTLLQRIIIAMHENLVNKIKIFLRTRSSKGMNWRKIYKIALFYCSKAV